jgi:N-formylglutamate amidohydrolase
MKNLSKLSLLTLASLLHGSLEAQETKSTSDWLTVWPGVLPIILSAPHGGREGIPNVAPRRGIGVTQFTTERDSNTAELAERVAGKIAERLGARPFLVIARFERKYVDANRPESGAYESVETKPYYDAYHRAIAAASSKIRQNWSAGLLLDIHGQRAEADTIFRGTDNGRSVTVLVRRSGRGALTGPKSILVQMASKGYKIDPSVNPGDRERRYTGGYTTRTYGSHRGSGIDAIQLEFGANLRARNNIERTADDLAHAIEIFAKSYLPLAETGARGAAPVQP